MIDHFGIAKQTILDPAQLSIADVETLLNRLMSTTLDYADLYFQYVSHETWTLEDSQIKGGAYSIDKGVGVRAVSGEKTGFAYSDDIAKPALHQAIDAAKSIVGLGQESSVRVGTPSALPQVYAAMDPLAQWSTEQKIDLLYSIDKAARAADSRVMQVNASLSGCYNVILIINSDGTLQADVRPMVSTHVSVIVEDKGHRESARSGGGGRCGYDFFLQGDHALSYAEEAVRQAVLNLTAMPAPAGSMPVVLGPGWPGVLLHEAVGHGLEGDFNRKSLSAYSGLIGKKVTASGITIVDDGTLLDRRGSLTIDDEGTPSQRNVLIEDGILKAYMQDSLNARLMGVPRTGNARRESYAHLPLPRMTNTFMLPGPYDPDEILSSVDDGLYAVNFSGGQVDITSGRFVFSASEAYRIEKGKVTTPVKGATLIGRGADVMNCVSMIGNDLALDQGIGVCGKEGQSVPVGVGQPTLKIDAITVGGTSIDA